MRLTVRTPATSANLGPGFDCFGLALDLCNDLEIDTERESGVTWSGVGAGELPTDGSDLIRSAMRRVAGDRTLPAFAMHGTNRIPLARGLGSSSAAVVAGVAAALVLLGDDPSPARVFMHAASIEGHPDNAAPACFGGFTIAMPDGQATRLEPNAELRPVLLVPDHLTMPTEEARAALPGLVPRADAVFNVAHAALAVQALTSDPSSLRTALRDRLHQEARLRLVPEAREVLEGVLEAGVPACVSGAGPSVIAFPPAGRDVPDPGSGWRVMPVPVRRTGFEVEQG